MILILLRPLCREINETLLLFNRKRFIQLKRTSLAKFKSFVRLHLLSMADHVVLLDIPSKDGNLCWSPNKWKCASARFHFAILIHFSLEVYQRPFPPTPKK